MTYIRIGGSSFSDKDIFAFVIVVLVIGIASWIGYFILKSINEQIQNIAQKKDTLCRRMYN